MRGRRAGPRLWLADRPFCDLIQTAAFVAEGGDHFLVRYHSKVHFYPDPARSAQQGRDHRGRLYEQKWGWLGDERDKRRRCVRRVTLHRDGDEAIILVTDLLDADPYPAEELRTLYLARWGIERVFQKITEVFHLNRLIATTPQGTLFQLSFCLLLYNMIQVVRGCSWIKAPTRTGKSAAAKQGKRENTSVYRLLKAHHQPGTKGTVT